MRSILRRSCLVWAMTCVACGAGDPASSPSSASTPLQSLYRTLGTTSSTIVDLTHPLTPDGLYWPTGTPFEHRRLAWGVNEAGYWYASAEFSSPEHLGTHLDAPVHFAEQGWTAADVPIDRLIGPGLVIDISSRVPADPDAMLEPEDIVRWEAEHGGIVSGTMAIVRSGWASRWPDWQRYYGSETPKDVTTLHFPGVSEAAAAMLVERGVLAVGIDTASIDAGRSQRFEAHRVLAAGRLVNLENLMNVDRLPATGFLLVALPMKIADGTGGPARIVAVVPSTSK
ncbi:MAG: cyclase family protein [Vicinamibacterales bacterium]